MLDPEISRLATTASASMRCGRFTLSFERPLVMGILNLTPDSFSDGGRWVRPDAAIRQAEQMLHDGADLLDLGGESTRPGAPPVPLAEERERVLPVLRALLQCGVPLSIDTYKPDMMRAALDAGADLINDIWAFRQPGAIDAVRGFDCGLCAMHMRGEPGSMQTEPVYQDLVAEVHDFLAERRDALVHNGVVAQRICLDPGFGFGKTVAHNFQLLANLRTVVPRGVPSLVGVSRKSMLGAVTGRATDARLAAGVAAATLALERGASILRVHDVAASVDALKVWTAVHRA